MYSILIGGACVGTALGVSASVVSEQPWYVSLLCAVIPSLLSFILSLILAILNKKGVISNVDKTNLEKKVEKVEEDARKEVEKDEQTNKDE